MEQASDTPKESLRQETTFLKEPARGTESSEKRGPRKIRPPSTMGKEDTVLLRFSARGLYEHLRPRAEKEMMGRRPSAVY